MIICTAFYAIALKKCGMTWEGAGASYIFALAADTFLIAFLIACLTGK